MWRRSAVVTAVVVGLAVSLAGPVSQSLAKAPASEAAKLGNELTPMGAIQAANADGTIPAWDGGITSPPTGYQPGTHHPNPFPNEQPVYTINAGNVQQYGDKLSPGQIAMLERYPDTWKLNVYPTHRTASFPQFVYDAAIANATSAELTGDGNGVTGCSVTSAFPIPQAGLEPIWNHLLRYRGKTIDRTVVQAAPTGGGSFTPVTIRESILLTYNFPGETVESIGNRLAFFLQEVTAPARLAGSILLVHETLDQKKEPRMAWVYNPGQRRVRRAPNVAYDNPGTASDAQRTNDQFDMFNGSPDRYNWELVGRKEMIVPYNTYELHSDQTRHDDIIQKGHINPDLTRYELHRVWAVDATLKDGTSHIYARRTFYFDEDSWQILAVDQYDGRGQIWRYSEAYCINYYDIPILWDTLQCHYDLQNGRYLAFGMNNEGNVEDFGLDFTQAQFTPEALRRKGRR